MSEASKPGGPFPRYVAGNSQHSSLKSKVLSVAFSGFLLIGIFHIILVFVHHRKPLWSNSQQPFLLGLTQTQPRKAMSSHCPLLSTTDWVAWKGKKNLSNFDRVPCVSMSTVRGLEGRALQGGLLPCFSCYPVPHNRDLCVLKPEIFLGKLESLSVSFAICPYTMRMNSNTYLLT